MHDGSLKEKLKVTFQNKGIKFKRQNSDFSDLPWQKQEK